MVFFLIEYSTLRGRGVEASPKYKIYSYLCTWHILSELTDLKKGIEIYKIDPWIKTESADMCKNLLTVRSGSKFINSLKLPDLRRNHFESGENLLFCYRFKIVLKQFWNLEIPRFQYGFEAVSI